ncbi:hypothetical protein EC973_007039 [Apophysomyces ossiformis]|uniref:HMG box domain-containing protein n=1 Tax=Apophysomyces ossiformis TaxID=679940 RepID=A0A8H7BPT1_9FUNG|nr:hypothetical protein EC973_007039 [Apophysomyces ossiformis]
MIEKKQDHILKDGKMICRQDILTAADTLLQEQLPQYDDELTDLLGQEYKDVQRGPRRPPNAFMLYSCRLRKRIKEVFPEYSNGEVSKFLGAMWRIADTEVKQKYYKLAEEQRQRHRNQFPHYVYNKKTIQKPTESNDLTFAGMPSSSELNWIDEMAGLMFQPMQLVSDKFSQPWSEAVAGVPFLEGNHMDGLFAFPIVTENILADDWKQICDSITECFPDFQDQTFQNVAWGNELELISESGNPSLFQS